VTLYRRGRVWHYEFELKGHRYRESCRTTKKTVARKVEERAREAILIGPPIEDCTLNALADKYWNLHARHKRGDFHAYKIKVLRREFGARLLSELSPEDVDAYRARLLSSRAPATVNRTLSVLKHMLKLAVRWKHLRESPAADLPLEREPRHRERFLSHEEARRLLAACPEWVRALVLAALDTGARQGDLLALHWRDVDIEQRLVTFRTTKEGQPRPVKIGETLSALLKQTPPSRRRGRVFRNHGGRRTHRDGLTWSFRRACRLAKLDGLRWHDLRHTAASWWVQQGVPLNTVRERLGHADLKMTLRYAHLAPGHQEAAARVMDGILAGVGPDVGI
jgi:integrase